MTRRKPVPRWQRKMDGDSVANFGSEKAVGEVGLLNFFWVLEGSLKLPFLREIKWVFPKIGVPQNG